MSQRRGGESPAHRYALHQDVQLHATRFSGARASETGVYRITRLMPADERGELSYRIEGKGSGVRAVRESEIERHVSPFRA